VRFRERLAGHRGAGRLRRVLSVGLRAVLCRRARRGRREGHRPRPTAAGGDCEAGFSAGFEVTNSSSTATTYTITFGFRAASGGAVDDVERTVGAVAPGRTVKGTVAPAETVGHLPEVSGVEVVRVRSVPAAEAPSASGPCPASGVHIHTDKGDAAMGLRVLGLFVVNCGTRPYELNGYPELELLDEDHHSVDGVRVLRGTDEISTAVTSGDSPRPVVLRPGEAARSILAWRNTSAEGEPVNAPYVRVRPKPGAARVTVTPELDLGTTGELGAGPWEKDETYAR
jgi:hypothetical protein